MKRWLWVAAILIIVIGTIVWLDWRAAPPPTGGEARVAAVLSLTGPAARFDAVKQRTLEVARTRVDSLYPEAGLLLRFFDAGGSQETTAGAIRSAEQWGAQYYLSGTSPNALAIAAAVRETDPRPVQLANAANPDFGPPRDGEYRFWPDWEQEAQLISDAVRKQGFESLVLIHSTDPYSQALTSALRSDFSRDSLSIAELPFDPAGTPDFRPALLRASEQSRDALIVFGLPPGINALLEQVAASGWSGAIIGGVNINLSLNAYDEAGLDNPLWLIRTESMADHPNDPETVAFREAYVEEYGERPPFHALYLADALYFVAEAGVIGDSLGLSAPVEMAREVESFSAASGHIRLAPDRTLRFNMTVDRAR